MAKYFINIRYQGEEFYWERYLRIFQGLQKELKRRNIDSILWNWWGPGLNELTPDKEIKDVTELVKTNANFLFLYQLKFHNKRLSLV